MYPPRHWVRNMETRPNGPQVLQRQTIYQAVRKPSVTPQMQQAIQSNASLPNLVQRGYEYSPISNTVASSGLNRSAETPNIKAMNQTNYVVQDVENSNKVVLWIHNPGYRSNNLNLNHVPGNKQRDQIQNIQTTGQGMSNASSANVATITTQKTFKHPNVANLPVKGPMKIPEPTHVNLNTHVNEKVGSLKIHISESFLPWNITNKTVLDLEFMRHLFNISGVDVILTDAKQNEKAIRAAVEQLLHSRVLPDWLVLKCEEKEIPFLKVNNQVEIYTASNFTALLNVVTQETCLPLPFITEEKNYIKYLYLNFPKTGNDKVKKLNTPIFHVADSGKKRLLCKYPGIRLDCDFENRVEKFIFHVHQSAFLAYETSVSKIRQHIIYRHVIWGFLQMWIRRVMDKYNQCFKFDDIAKNLSLCKSEDGKSCGNDSELTYDIGYLNFYLKFDPVILKETKATFMLDNFSTNTVCNLAIVQFYKQFFLINDMHYSDALKNSVLFFQDQYGKNVVRASNYVNIPPGLKAVRLIPRTNESAPEQVVPLLSDAYKNVVNRNLSGNTSGRAVSQSITIGNNYRSVIQVGPNKSSAIPVSEKPRLKARTVEEINSSVDIVNRTDVNNSVAASDLLETRTVNEMNSSANIVQRTEINNRPVVPAVNQTPDAKRRDNTRRLNYGSFVSLIQKFMENCYASNKTELCSRDESNEEVIINRRFDEAVRRAIGMETIELFIEKIYVYLQLYYTNSTSQNILNKMIWRAIEAKYPHLKEHVSKNIAKSLKDKLFDGDPRDSNKSSSVLESHGRLNETITGNNQNGNQNSTSTVVVAQQPDITNTNSEEVVCSSGENDQAVSAISKDQDVDLGNEVTERGREVSSPCIGAEKITEQEPPVPPAMEEPQDGNACSSESMEEPKDRNPCSSESMEDPKDGNACSSESLDEPKDGTTCSSESLVECKGGDDYNFGSLEEPKDGNACSSESLEEPKDGDACSSESMEESKDGTTCSSESLEESKDDDASSSESLEEPKDGNACSSESLEEPKDGDASSSESMEESKDDDASSSESLEEPKDGNACSCENMEELKDGTTCSSESSEESKGGDACSSESSEESKGGDACSSESLEELKDGTTCSSESSEESKSGDACSSESLEAPKDGTTCSSESSEECLPSSDCEMPLQKTKKHSKPKRSKESEKEGPPYRNTLTFVRVSTSPATFRISSRSEINSKTQGTELKENESCRAPAENSIQASNEISESEQAPEEPEQSAQTVEEIEECPRQEDYSKYNLKPCSVVLNSNEVKTYMERYRKKRRRAISLEESDVEQDEDYVPGRVRRRYYAEDSDDSDFITERKRIRRAVSEIQYMEARTRVLQRLRKRKSLYGGYERTRISGEELDSFLVRQGSLSKLNQQEDSGEDSEGEYEIGEEKDSEAEESQRRKTRKTKWPAMKEVRVVLVRLEDTPEYEEHRERLVRKENWNPSVDFLNQKKFPHIKKKYFEIREGKLYLKDGYCVRDGEIVQADDEDSPMRPKREPESPVRETDFDYPEIKREDTSD